MEKNTVEIKVVLKNYDEIIEKLEQIKKLLNEINEIGIHLEAASE